MSNSNSSLEEHVTEENSGLIVKKYDENDQLEHELFNKFLMEKGELDDAAVAMLQKHPHLAKTQFPQKYRGMQLPLTIIAMKPGATLSHVQTVYNLFPEAIKYDSDGEEPLPIFGAIFAKARPEVIEFMIRAYPESLRRKCVVDCAGERSIQKCLPIHSMFLHGWLRCSSTYESNEEEQLHLQVLKTCLDLYPESVLERIVAGLPEYRMTTLELAIICRSEKAIDLMAERMPKHIDKLEFREFSLDVNASSRLALKAISVLLPQLREIAWSIPWWGFCIGPFNCLFDILHKGDTTRLEALRFYLPRRKLEEKKELRDVLQRAMANNSNIRSMHLGIENGWRNNDDNTGNDTLAFGAVTTGILTTEKPPLSSLHLHSWKVFAPSVFATLVSSRHCPHQLFLYNCVVGGDWDYDNDSTYNQSFSTLECLSFQGAASDLSVGFVTGLITIASLRCPYLKTLRIGKSHGDNNDTSLDVTDSVVQLMQQGVVEELRLGYEMRLPSLSLALRQNSSVKKLSVFVTEAGEAECKELVEAVDQHNTTLERMELFPLIDSVYRRKVDYKLCLNEHGRGRVRDPHITMTEFVDILSSAAKCAGWGDRECFQGWSRDDQAHAILYGMLCENPSLWTTRQR